jgi:hypothetical protein
MISILFFIPLLVIGSNYDLDQTGDNEFLWTSHYPRILDGGQWVNYIWSDDGNTIRFDSASLSYELNKSDCSFVLFEPNTNIKSIERYSKTLLINDIVTSLPACTITNITPTINGLDIITTQNGAGYDFKTIFESTGRGSIEWTYEMVNGDFLTSKRFKIIEDCLNCTPERSIGDLIILGDYILDTKNRIHDRLLSTDTRSGVKLTFESQPRGFMEKEIIDPDFSSVTAYNGRIQTNNGITTPCETLAGQSSLKYTDSSYAFVSVSSTNQPCARAFIEWDTSTIPDFSNILDVQLNYDVTSASGGRNCDINAMVNKPSGAATAYTLWTDIGDGNQYISNDSGCTTVSDGKVLNLGSLALTDLKNLLGSNWFAIGIKYVSETRDASGHQTVFRLNDAQLNIHYSLYEPPTGSISHSINKIGDVFNLQGIITVDDIANSTPANITSIILAVNGTIINTNSTIHNGTSAPYNINFGPFWYQATDGDLRNFTSIVTMQNQNSTAQITNETITARQYGPNYISAIVPTQGLVNYSFPDAGTININRDLGGATFQIECNYIELSNAFLNTESALWTNQTNIGAFSESYPQSARYVSCYNDDLLFTTAIPNNYTSQLQGGLIIFDELGGFMGAPAALLVVLGLISMATGRNFPVIAVITIATVGIMGALGLLIMDGALWGFLIVAAGITIFGIRKFF